MTKKQMVEYLDYTEDGRLTNDLMEKTKHEIQFLYECAKKWAQGI